MATSVFQAVSLQLSEGGSRMPHIAAGPPMQDQGHCRNKDHLCDVSLIAVTMCPTSNEGVFIGDHGSEDTV